jgi:hypothetical protein
MVKSGALTRVTALIPVKSSGSEVTRARSTTPIQTLPSPVLMAMISPYLATALPEKKITATQKTNFNQTNQTKTDSF